MSAMRGWVICILLFSNTGILFAQRDGGSSRRKIDPFELRWMNHPIEGTMFRSCDYPGSVFILALYQRNCPACSRNAPTLNRLYDEFLYDDTIRLTAVGADCRDNDYANYISRYQPRYPVLNDCERGLAAQLESTLTPQTVILDCSMHEVKRFAGVLTDENIDEMRAVIQSLTEGGCTPPEGDFCPALSFF